MTVINKNNIHELENKKPIILYYCPGGACGPSGLFFIVFEDKSIYAYNTLLEKSDSDLITKVVELVPELSPLLRLEKDINFKRDRFEDLDFIYLGLGNVSLVNSSLVSYLEDENKDEYTITLFKELLEKETNEDISRMFDIVRSEING